MKRTDLNKGDIVAVFDYQDGASLPYCIPVRIKRIEARKTQFTGRSSYTWSGIHGIVLSEALEDVPVDGERYLHGRKPGFVRENIKANRIYSKWSDYAAQRADADREKERRDAATADARARTAEKVEHMLSLVPAAVWAEQGILWEASIGSRAVSVEQLTALLEAARAAGRKGN